MFRGRKRKEIRIHKHASSETIVKDVNTNTETERSRADCGRAYKQANRSNLIGRYASLYPTPIPIKSQRHTQSFFLSQALLPQPVPGATNEVGVLDQPLVVNTALMARGAFGRQTRRVDSIELDELVHIHVGLRLFYESRGWRMRMHW